MNDFEEFESKPLSRAVQCKKKQRFVKLAIIIKH